MKRRFDHLRSRDIAAPAGTRHVLQKCRDAPGGFIHLRAFGLPDCADPPEDVGKPGTAVPGLRGKICPAVEGSPLRREEHRHGPPAVLPHRLQGGHIDPVEIGSLFTIDFDADEIPVEDGGDGIVFERLPLHHVAPVAGGVPDREEHGDVPVARAFKCLFAPGVPVDGIVGVLQEVGTLFVDQAVRFSFSVHPGTGARRGTCSCAGRCRLYSTRSTPFMPR